MATVKEFLIRINQIEGVDGCLLIKDDGSPLGHMIDDAKKLSSLLTIGGKYARDIMDKAGFTYCRHLTFDRENGEKFYLFPVDKFYLGLMQTPDCPEEEMIKKVNYLLSLVKTSGPQGKTAQAKGEGNGESL